MKRKILIVLSFVIVALVAMGCVSAFEINDIIPDIGSIFGSEPDQNVTIDGITFHIPGTFKENTNISKNGTVEEYYSFKTISYAKGYQNDTNYINILIFEYDGTDLDENLINYMDGTSKNINGTDGYLFYDGIGYTFSYAQDNKVVSIQTDNENIIANVIA